MSETILPLAGSGSLPYGSDGPTLFLLHWLGGSARTWQWVIPRLASRFRCVAVDLPGFGEAEPYTGFSVEEMAEAVASAVRSQAPARWAIVGHSMGAKVATVLARRAEDGESGLGGLSHVVLLAGSPPSPEPMDEKQRHAMMGWFTGDAEACRGQAQGFVDQNVGEPLDRSMNEVAVADVLRADRRAWQAWLGGGSREDWSDRVGVLRTPALIISGESDGDLGPDAQARLMAPHFAAARQVTLAGVRHLLPLERPETIARLIIEEVGDAATAETAMPGIGPDYAALIASARVSRRTRAVLHERGQPDEASPTVSILTPDLLAILRAVVDRVVPQKSGTRIDLAARIDAMLAAGQGDGWRFAVLPPDAEAYAAALRTLDVMVRARHGQPFVLLDGAAQDGLLDRVGRGDPADRSDEENLPLLSPIQLKLWFEDLRADTVRLYVSHPATLERIGYSGIANGGDGERKQGFSYVGVGDLEAWEPLSKIGTAS